MSFPSFQWPPPSHLPVVSEPPPVTLVFDRLPVSKSNGYKYSPGSNRIYVTKAAKTWQHEIEQALAPTVERTLGAYFPSTADVKVSIYTTWQAHNQDGSVRQRYPDTDGAHKAVMDAAQHAGLFSNDKIVRVTHAETWPGLHERCLITFERCWPFGHLETMPTIPRGEWAEEQRARALVQETPVYAEEVARCWNCDILIGGSLIEQEIWLFTGHYHGQLLGAIVCSDCAEQLALPPLHALYGATELAQVAPQLRHQTVTERARSRFAPELALAQGPLAREFLRRLRTHH